MGLFGHVRLLSSKGRENRPGKTGTLPNTKANTKTASAILNRDGPGTFTGEQIMLILSLRI